MYSGIMYMTVEYCIYRPKSWDDKDQGMVSLPFDKNVQKTVEQTYNFHALVLSTRWWTMFSMAMSKSSET